MHAPCPPRPRVCVAVVSRLGKDPSLLWQTAESIPSWKQVEEVVRLYTYIMCTCAPFWFSICLCVLLPCGAARARFLFLRASHHTHHCLQFILDTRFYKNSDLSTVIFTVLGGASTVDFIVCFCTAAFTPFSLKMSLLKNIPDKGAVLAWSRLSDRSNLVALGTKVYFIFKIMFCLC